MSRGPAPDRPAIIADRTTGTPGDRCADGSTGRRARPRNATTPARSPHPRVRPAGRGEDRGRLAPAGSLVQRTHLGATMASPQTPGAGTWRHASGVAARSRDPLAHRPEHRRMAADADRHLLFGLLALQNGLIQQ